MKEWLNFKLRLNEAVKVTLTQKLNTLENAFAESRQALNSESKSTAGDKHETGRAMIQLEMEKLGNQLQAAEEQMKLLNSLSTGIRKKANLGALIKLSSNFYYLSLSMGKVHFEGYEVFLLSGAAPLAQAMLGKQQGDTIHFRGNELALEVIV